MRLPLVVLVILSVATLSAQQPTAAKKPAEAAKPPTTANAPKPKVVPDSTPAPKRGVFSRMFGSKPKPTPTPAPTTPTPKPKQRVRVKTPKPETTDSTPDPKPETTERPKPPGKTPKTTDVAKLDDATKYKTARTAALEDDQIKELKNKADSALDEEEAHRASIAYNKALFRKIRQLEPSIDAYVDQLEAAMMKRLNSEKVD